MCRKSTALCCLLVLFAATAATAQVSTGTRLSARMQTRTTTARPDTPIALVWDLKWTGIDILEGHLEIVVRDGQQVVGYLKTDDIVVSTGERRFETRLPILSTEGYTRMVQLEAVFVASGRRFNLGEYTFSLQEYGKRVMTVGVSDAWGMRFSARHAQLVHSLRLERFNPNSKDSSLLTSLGNIPTNEMPSDALGYCAYNMLVLMDEGFADLRAKQLDAIYDWTAAGGGVCVVPGGGLTSDHIAFLDRLAARDEQAQPFVPDSEGRLLAEGGVPQFRLLRPGVGRAAVVIAADDASRNIDSPAWREMAAFLWNVKSQNLPRLVDDGNWIRVPIRNARTQAQFGIQAEAQDYKFEYSPIYHGGWMLDRLMPESVKVVPLGLIGLILAGYVLLIGPVDYFLLGAIKQRKLTWLMFPLVTLGVTLFTVWLSQWYMQPSEDRRTVEFLDVGDTNEIARRSRFELLFTSTPREIETKLSGAIFAPLNSQQFGSRAQQMYMQYGYGYAGDDFVKELVGRPDYAGRIPGDYTVTQTIPQWTPQINRQLFIGTEPKAAGRDASTIDWGSLKPPVADSGQPDVGNAEWHSRLKQTVPQLFDGQTSIWVMRGESVHQLHGDITLFLRQNSNRYNQDMYGPQVAYTYEDGVPTPSSRNENFLTETCKRPHYGLYSLVSRIAPNGGPNFEDLPILDPTDENECLLVVAVEKEGHLKIYRKLYVVGD